MDEGHDVVLHARSRERAAALSDLAVDAAGVVIGDLSSAAETRELAGQVNQIGRMDAVIHNADVFLEPSRSATAEGHAKTLAGVRSVLGLPDLRFLIRLPQVAMSHQAPARSVHLSAATRAASALAWLYGVGSVIGPAQSRPNWWCRLESWRSMDRACFSKNEENWPVLAVTASTLRS